MSTFSDALCAALAAVAPVTNLDMPDETDRTKWRVGFGEAATSAQRAAAQAVLASFTMPVVPPSVSGDAIIGALSKVQAGQVDVRDMIRIANRDDVPATNSKLVRMAKVIGMTPDALRTAGAVTGG